MTGIIEPLREIDVIGEADVVVVGGGPAGVGAALAAARTGAGTVLVELLGSLGGMQTNGNSAIFAFVDPELHSGIIRDILARLEDAGAMKRISEVPATRRNPLKTRLINLVGMGNLPQRIVETEVGYWGRWGYCFDAEYYKYLLDNMMAQAGVKLFYHSFAVGAVREGNSLKGVIIETREGRKAILAKVVIDTTGTGDIVWKSGAPCLGAEGIPLGQHKTHYGGMLSAFFIGGVDIGKFRAFKEINPQEWSGMYGAKSILEQARRNGSYIRIDKAIISEQFDVYNNGKIFVMTLLYPVAPGSTVLSTKELTDAEIDLRKQARALYKVFKESIPGFENSYIDRMANMPLTSNGHRILGEYVMTVEDMRQGRVFADSVAVNNMPGGPL